MIRTDCESQTQKAEPLNSKCAVESLEDFCVEDLRLLAKSAYSRIRSMFP